MQMLSKHRFSIPAIQPNEKPTTWTVPKIAWLQAQMDDVPLLYHLGSLSEDCDDIDRSATTAKDPHSPEAKYLRKIRAVFWDSAMAGKIYLVQKRWAPPAKYRKPTFEYWSHPVPPK
jgi:hypothetical protein